ncbi:ABC transporter ATP-binding protein [Candidatus Bathyarchaeota archaeon]|nr:MAG: ABC transporter ATP-binding protein [Candidatus Bathyarchaeota archaeon]
MDAVKSIDLVKVYHSKEKVKALKNVNISIQKGELFTLLGPNGAGKTTFLRIISTQLLPTSGEAYVLDHNVLTEPVEVRKHIAVVPQDVATYGNFTPWEYSYYFSRLRGMSKSEAKNASKNALKAVELWNLRNRTCATLSGGEKKRAIIAAALASNAEIFMLDEPTSGLDAVARRKVWAVLREIIEQGKTILLTTHIMEEAEMVSDRLAIIHKGAVIAEGSPEQIKLLAKEKFRVVVEGNLNSLSVTENNNHIVKFGSKWIIYVKDEDEALEIARKALKNGLKAETAPITLEDVFVKLVGGEAG